MRSVSFLRTAICLSNLVLCSGCSAEVPSSSLDPTSATAVNASSSNAVSAGESVSAPEKRIAPLGSPKKAAFAPLGSPKTASAANSGSPAKPKFALKNQVPMGSTAGGNAPDRAAEVKRLIAAYEAIALSNYDSYVMAKTEEDKQQLAQNLPSARALRPITRLLAHVVAVDPKDEPALDSLVFLGKYLGVTEIDAVLAEDSEDNSSYRVDVFALLVEHHANNPKIIEAMRRLPYGDKTDMFLQTLFEKTRSPQVRWMAGAQLIASLKRNGRPDDDLEPIVIAMAEDRYLEGVTVGTTNARQWAENKLTEIRTLGIGQVLPEVYGEKLDGGIGHISDYRGKVVVLDVWTTWCGPCFAMIPHEVEMVDRLKEKPFVLLSVSCDQDKETLETYLKATSMPWDHWWVAPDSEFKKTLNIASFPTIYVLDAKGVIRHKNIKDEELENAVNNLLEEIADTPADTGG